MGTMTKINTEAPFYLCRDNGGGGGGLATLDRMRQERQACVEFVQRTLEGVEDGSRDLSDTEQESLETQKKRIAELDKMIKPLQEFDELRGTANSTLRNYSSTARDRADEDEDGADAGERRGLGFKVKHRGHEYNSRGEVIVDLLRQEPGRFRSPSGHADVSEVHRSAARDRLMGAGVMWPGAPDQYAQRIANQTTDDTPGLLPKAIVGAVESDLDAARPFVSSVGAKPLAGIPGKTFSRPVITQHVAVGPQPGEKQELPSRQMKIDGVDFTKTTYGGAVDISRQDIDWTSPSAWDALLQDLQDVYAIETEEAAATAFEAAVTQTSPAPATDDLKGWATALYQAAAKAYGGGKRLPDTMWVSLDMWALMGAVVDAAKVQTSEGALGGGQSLANFAGNILSIPRIVVPSLSEGTVILGPRSKTEFYEERVGFLQAVEPKLFGIELAYGGYATWGTLRPTAFAKLTQNEVTTGTWEASTAYDVDDEVILSGGAILQATTAGTSGATEPAAPAVDGTVTDGTVEWVRVA